MRASNSCCISVMQSSCSTTSQTGSAGLRSGGCGVHLNSPLCSRKQYEMIWTGSSHRRSERFSNQRMDMANNNPEAVAFKQCSVVKVSPPKYPPHYNTTTNQWSMLACCLHQILALPSKRKSGDLSDQETTLFSVIQFFLALKTVASVFCS